MAVARLATGVTHPPETLRGLGLATRSCARVGLAIPASVVIVGCVLAVAGAVLASPLVPVGSARLVDPDPGVWIDAGVLFVGGLALAVGLTLVAAATARLDKLHAPRRSSRARAPVQLPLSMGLGQDLAYRESSWGRLALAATGVGLGLVVSVSVYLASLDRLVDSPPLFGSDFDTILYPADDVGSEEPFADVALDDPAIEAAAIAQGAQVTVAGDLLEAQVIEPVRGVLGGTILRGRAPQASDEVAIGPTTANRIGLGVGDEVLITGTRERTMRIVGEAVLPPPGQGAYGDVIWLVPAAIERLELELQEPRLLLNLSEDVTDDDVAALIGDHFDSAPTVPDDVSNLDDVGQIPFALEVFGVLLSGAVVAFALVGIVRRRRHDLAILHALGLSSRQTRRSVLTAGLLIVGPGVVIGVTIGVVLGRAYWSSVAAGVPALAQPVVPLGTTALVVLGTLMAGACSSWDPPGTPPGSERRTSSSRTDGAPHGPRGRASAFDRVADAAHGAPEGLPGILGPLTFRPETTPHLLRLADALLRDDSPLRVRVTGAHRLLRVVGERVRVLPSLARGGRRLAAWTSPSPGLSPPTSAPAPVSDKLRRPAHRGGPGGRERASGDRRRRSGRPRRGRHRRGDPRHVC